MKDSCLFCAGAGCAVCTGEWPEWFGAGTGAQAERVARGLHPLGQRLSNNGHTCGDCAHLRRKALAKDYLKCILLQPEGGASTDVRRKWPACDLWQMRTITEG